MPSLKKILTTIITSVFFILLILSFTLWGVGDIFRPGQSNYLAKIENTKITAQEYLNSIERLKLNYQQQGQSLTNEMLIQTGLYKNILDSLIFRAEMQALSDKIGLKASPEKVRETIEEMDVFKDYIKNKFDIKKYKEVLIQAQMEPKKFEKLITQDLVLQQLNSAIATSISTPTSIYDLELGFFAEERTVKAISLPETIIKQPEAPIMEVLKSYIKQNETRYLSPEFRSFTMIHLQESDFAPDIKITEEEAKKEYKLRKKTVYYSPEMRSVIVLEAKDQKQAEHIKTQLEKGKSPDILSDALGLPKPVTHEKITPEKLIDLELAKQIFQEKKGKIARVKTELGWFVYNLTDVFPEKNISYEQVKEKLKKELIHEKALAKLEEQLAILENARDSGQGLEQAVKMANLSLSSYSDVDANGKYKNGDTSYILSTYPEILKTLFEQKSINFETETLEDKSGGYYILRLDSITPAKLKPFDEIKDQAIKNWINSEKVKRLNTYIETLKTEIKEDGKSLEEIAQNINQPIDTILLSRLAPTEKIGVDLRSKIFNLSIGGIASGYTKNQAGMMIANLVSIEENQDKISPYKEQIKQNLSNSLQEDITQSMAQALQKQMKIYVNYDKAKDLILGKNESLQ